jgi:hypothetical protein
MTTVLSKLIFKNEYVVILNKNDEAIGVDKVSGFVGKVIILKNGSKYNEDTLTSKTDETKIAPYYTLTAHRTLSAWEKENKIKKFRHRVLFKLFKEFALRFTFDTCSQLTQEKSKLTPIKYVITPLELEQTISEKVAELYKGEYYDREPVQN